jgi:hypothetical protein
LKRYQVKKNQAYTLLYSSIAAAFKTNQNSQIEEVIYCCSASIMQRHLSAYISLLSLLKDAAGFAPPSTQTSFPKSSFRLRRGLFDALKTTSIDTTDILITADKTQSQLGAWIPLGSASCLDGLTPTQIQVCGLDLVVWQSKDKHVKKGECGTFSALMDACPHRLAPLSQGRVDPVTRCLGERLFWCSRDFLMRAHEKNVLDEEVVYCFTM